LFGDVGPIRVLAINLSDVVGGNHDIAEALASREKERNVPAFNRVMTAIVGISAVDGVATPVPYLCRSAASHGVSIVSSKLFPSMLT
jgi:hypothetical protein